MTDPAKAKPEEKSKYYFGIVPKEEFPKFMERLKAGLAKTENKKGDKKSFEFEVKGAKDELNGLSLEIFTFDKARCGEFLDLNQENIKAGLYCASLNLEVKEESDVPKLEEALNKFKPMLLGIPAIKDKIDVTLRNQGKKVSLDVVSKEGKLVSALLDLGVDMSEYHKFNFALKSGINLTEIFDPNADQNANAVKICSSQFLIKSETDNVKYLAGALGEALKDLKLDDEKKQKKFNKVVGLLNFITSFIGAKLKLEYDPVELAGEGTKEAEKQAGGAEGLKAKITEQKQNILLSIQNLAVPMITMFGVADTLKAINLDSISLSLGVPKYQNGYAISIKIPGLSDFVTKLLDTPPQQPPK